jgi:uncharacterized protein YqeY
MDMKDIVKDLTIERYSVKNTNPLRSTVVIPMILSEAKALAKEAGRGVLEQDIQTVAKSYLKKLETTMKAYEGLPASGPLENILKEIKEVKTFLPKQLTVDETRVYLINAGVKIASLKELGQALVRLPPTIDKTIATKVLKELMK